MSSFRLIAYICLPTLLRKGNGHHADLDSLTREDHLFLVPMKDHRFVIAIACDGTPEEELLSWLVDNTAFPAEEVSGEIYPYWRRRAVSPQVLEAR